MWLEDFQSTYMNFLCSWKIIRQIPSTSCAARRLSDNIHHVSLRPEDLSTSVNIGYTRRASVNLSQLLCDWEIFCLLPSKFHAAGRPSINFCQISVHWETFRQLLSTFQAARRTSVNFLNSRETFRKLSVRLGDLQPTSLADWRPSVK